MRSLILVARLATVPGHVVGDARGGAAGIADHHAIAVLDGVVHLAGAACGRETPVEVGHSADACACQELIVPARAGPLLDRVCAGGRGER